MKYIYKKYILKLGSLFQSQLSISYLKSNIIIINEINAILSLIIYKTLKQDKNSMNYVAYTCLHEH